MGIYNTDKSEKPINETATVVDNGTAVIPEKKEDKKEIYLTGTLSESFTNALRLMYSNEMMTMDAAPMINYSNDNDVPNDIPEPGFNNIDNFSSADTILFCEDCDGINDMNKVIKTVDGLSVSLSKGKKAVLALENSHRANKYGVMLEEYAVSLNIPIARGVKKAFDLTK